MISRKIIIYIILSAVFIILTLAAVDIVLKQKYDAIRINISGRQRMLIQKLSKELILHSYKKIDLEEIKKTITVFEDTLNALGSGGDVPVDLDMKEFRKIPPPNEEEIKTEFLKITGLWKEFKRNSILYMNTLEMTYLDFIVKENLNLMNEINLAVSMIESKAERRRLVLMTVISIQVFALIALLLFLLWSKIIEVKKAKDAIRNLEKFLPICSNCKKIRRENSNPDIQESWVDLEQYLLEKKDITFSHSICPECISKLYPGIK